MKSPEVNFHLYLRREVDQAGKLFEQATTRVFALTGGREIESGPALLEATEYLSEAMRVYIGAIRRLAHFSAHRAEPAPQEQFASAMAIVYPG